MKKNKSGHMAYNKCRGFTLIELIAVVVIIGVLASISAPTFKKFIAKARQSEAKINLAQIGTLQDVYKLEHGSYITLADIGAGTCTGSAKKNTLGFRPKHCDTLRYRYSSASSTATAISGSSQQKYYVYPGCAKSDTWKYLLSSGNFSAQQATENILKLCE